MVNQKDIAAAAGVSRATVSRAFTQNANISPKTLNKIQNAMKRLGLNPLPCYSAGDNKKSRHVIIIAGDVANSFYSHIIKGICDKLQSLGIYSIVCNSNYDSRLEEEQIRYAQENSCLGIFFVTAVESATFIDRLKKCSIPIVLVNRYIHSLDTNMVCLDNYSGGYTAADSLLQNGHTKIAVLAGERHTTPQQDRVRGFQDAVRHFGNRNITYKVFFGKQDTEQGERFADKIIKTQGVYTAVFATSCQVAYGLVNRLRKFDVIVPKNLSVICFDDSILIDERGLNLSTICYDPYNMGLHAADALIQCLEKDSAEKIHLMLEPELIDRGSVIKPG
jgi:LacI family transcriptional regulator